jgi:hypothetical protein
VQGSSDMRCRTRGRTCGRQNVLLGHDGCGSVPFSLFSRRLMASNGRSPLCPVIQDAGMLPVSALSSCTWQARSVETLPRSGCMSRLQCTLFGQSQDRCLLALGSIAPSSGIAGWESCCWRPKRQEGTHSAGSFPATALSDWSFVPRRAVGSCSNQVLVFNSEAMHGCSCMASPCACRLAPQQGFEAHPVSALYARSRP